jgi:hypothetical protein
VGFRHRAPPSGLRLRASPCWFTDPEKKQVIIDSEVVQTRPVLWTKAHRFRANSARRPAHGAQPACGRLLAESSAFSHGVSISRTSTPLSLWAKPHSTLHFAHTQPSRRSPTSPGLWAKRPATPDFAQTPLLHFMGETAPHHPFRPYSAVPPRAHTSYFMGEKTHIP